MLALYLVVVALLFALVQRRWLVEPLLQLRAAAFLRSTYGSSPALTPGRQP